MFMSNDSVYFNDYDPVLRNGYNLRNIIKSGDKIELLYSESLNCKFVKSNEIVSSCGSNITLYNLIIYKTDDLGTRDKYVRDNDIVAIYSLTNKKIIGKYIIKNWSNFNNVITNENVITLTPYNELIKFNNIVDYSSDEENLLKLKVFEIRLSK